MQKQLEKQVEKEVKNETIKWWRKLIKIIKCS